jgi:acrylyl-CoA reductase (NADPH)
MHTGSILSAVTVLPFILRNVSVLGVDSVELPIEQKNKTWTKLATQWQLDCLSEMTSEIGLSELSDVVDRILAGSVTGRTLLVHSKD